MAIRPDLPTYEAKRQPDGSYIVYQDGVATDWRVRPRSSDTPMETWRERADRQRRSDVGKLQKPLQREMKRWRSTTAAVRALIVRTAEPSELTELFALIDALTRRFAEHEARVSSKAGRPRRDPAWAKMIADAMRDFKLTAKAASRLLARTMLPDLEKGAPLYRQRQRKTQQKKRANQLEALYRRSRDKTSH